MPTMPSRVAIAINPRAGRGAGIEAGGMLFSALVGAGHSVHELAADDDLGEPADVDALVVVGGDGTVNRGASLVVGTGIPLGIVPTGTGNDIARGLGLVGGDADAAIRHVIDGLGRPPRLIDMGRITDADGGIRYFVGVFSGGFDAIVNERANRMPWPRGPSRYTLALLRELAALRPIDYTLRLDGDDRIFAAIMIAVANNPSFGGGMRIAPDALLDDGLFDVVWLTPVGRMSLLRLFPRVFSGSHVADPRVSVKRASTVTLSAPGIIAYADGERMGPLDVTLSMMPRALAVLN